MPGCYVNLKINRWKVYPQYRPVHVVVGTSTYAFIWDMLGGNQPFSVVNTDCLVDPKLYHLRININIEEGI